MADARVLPPERRPQSGVLVYLGAAHFVNDMLTGSISGILPYLQSAFGLSFVGLGLLVTLSNFTSSMAQPAFGLAGDRRDIHWVLPFGPVVAAVGLVALGHASDVQVAFACVLLLGLGSAAFHPEGARAAYLAAGSRRGLAQAVFQVGGNLGYAFGPLMVPLLVGQGGGLGGLSWTLLPAMVIVAAGVAMRGRLAANARAPRPIPRPAPDAEARRMRRVLVALLAVIALRSFVQLGVASFLPLYLVDVRHATVSSGDTMAFVFLAAGAVGTYAGGWLADRVGAVAVVRASMILSVPLMAVLPFLGGVWFTGDLAVLGFAVLSTFAVTVVLGQALLPGAVGVSSGLTIGLSVGAGGLGTALLGVLADQAGVGAVLRILWLLPAAGFALSLGLREPTETGAGVAA